MNSHNCVISGRPIIITLNSQIDVRESFNDVEGRGLTAYNR